jgi:hypothetical protein
MMCCLNPDHIHSFDNELLALEQVKRSMLADNLYKAEMLSPAHLPVKPDDPMRRRFRELIWESKK